MPILECDVFSQKDGMDPALLADLTIQGGSEVIQDKMKLRGWDGSSPGACVGLTVDSQGSITQSELFLMGVKDSIRLDATIVFGGERHEKDYVKIQSINLADFMFKGSLVSEWVDNNDFDWVYRQYNPNTQKYREVGHLDENGMKKMDINKLFLRCHVSPIPGMKVQVRLGVAVCKDVEQMVGFNFQNFPVISINKEFNAALLPEEPSGANWGIGISPFIIHSESNAPPLPASITIKQAVAGLMKNIMKPTYKTKHKTWSEVVGAGFWEEVPTNFTWPDPLPETEDCELGTYFSKTVFKTFYQLMLKCSNCKFFSSLFWLPFPKVLNKSTPLNFYSLN